MFIEIVGATLTFIQFLVPAGLLKLKDYRY